MKLVDTSVVVDIDRGGVDDRVARLDDEGRHAVSVVSITELRLGVNRRYGGDDERLSEAREALGRLLARFEAVEVTTAVATAAADLFDELRRQGNPLHDLHDVYVAASALERGLPVLTANVDHFERVDGIDVVDWASF